MIRKLLSVHPKFWLFALSALALLFLVTILSQNSLLAHQEQTLAELNAEYIRLIEENAALQHDINYTYTDEYIIREARGKLNMILPGETLFKSAD